MKLMHALAALAVLMVLTVSPLAQAAILLSSSLSRRGVIKDISSDRWALWTGGSIVGS